MIQSFKRPLIDEPNPLKALKGQSLEGNIYALIKSRASNAISALRKAFRPIHGSLGLTFQLIPLITVYFTEMLGRGRGGGERSSA